MPDQQFNAKITPLKSFPVKWAWPDSDVYSMILKNGDRLVIPGYINQSRTVWGNQQWKFLNPQAPEATRQLVRIQSLTAGGVLKLQRWDGNQEVTDGQADLPTVQHIFQGQNNAFVFLDETASDFALLNDTGADCGLAILAVYDQPLQASGEGGALGT